MFLLARRQAQAAPAPIAKLPPLHEIVGPVLTGLTQADMTQKRQILEQFKAFIDEQRLTRQQLIDAISIASNGYENDWIDFFAVCKKSIGFDVFPSSEQPQLQGSSQPEAYEFSLTIIQDAAIAHTSIFIVGPNRSGKSSLQRAIAGATISVYPDAEFLFLDLQTTKFLGLQRTDAVYTLPVLERDEKGQYPVVNHCPNTVTQVTSGEQSHMLLATELIKKAWNTYRERSRIRQVATRSGPDVPDFHILRFFVNEWNIFYNWASTYSNSKADRKQFAEDARARGITDPLYPLDALDRIRYIISSGGELKISVCLAGQEYTATASGLPPQMQNNTAVIAVGRIDPIKKQGGYSSCSLVAKDPHKIQDAATREILMRVVEDCIKIQKPILVSTQGFGSVGELPNHEHLAGQSILNIYRWEVI